ncbi:hypothetical protein B0H14DRAFT_2598397 [Mycena olivaceomarginata]|nr:hypothetical protein B0H14DRAFT_2598397 [Mycena olivaceomarginata]
MDPSGISVLTAQRQWFLCFSPFLSMNNYRSPVPLGFGQLAKFVEAIMEDVDTRSLLISGFCTVNRITNESRVTGGDWDGEARVASTCGRRRRRDRAAGTKRSAEVEGGRSARELPGEEAAQMAPERAEPAAPRAATDVESKEGIQWLGSKRRRGGGRAVASGH